MKLDKESIRVFSKANAILSSVEVGIAFKRWIIDGEMALELAYQIGFVKPGESWEWEATESLKNHLLMALMDKAEKEGKSEKEGK